MLSRSIKSIKPFASQWRSMSTSKALLSNNEGATSGNDAFANRERAQENAYIRKHQAEQLQKLKDDLAKQKETIDKLSDEIKNLKD